LESVLCWLHESFTGHAPPNRISPCSQLRIELVAYGLRICRLVGLRWGNRQQFAVFA